MNDSTIGYAGVHWAMDGPAVCVVNAQGTPLVPLCCLAGVAPSTRASGRHRVITFRWASDTKLREAICDFAGDSWRGNEWAAHRYRQPRASGKAHPHAEHILARSWTHIIWRCWQDNTPYDPARHGGLQRLKDEAA